MTTALVPDTELIVGAFLRSHAGVVALDTRVVGDTPSNIAESWVQVVELDAPSDSRSKADHLIACYFQISCYSSASGLDGSQQKEVSLLGRTIRAVLQEMPDDTHTGAVVSRVRINGYSRIPDVSIEPARQRRIIMATIWVHAT